MSDYRLIIEPNKDTHEHLKDKDGCYSLDTNQQEPPTITFEYCRDAESLDNTQTFNRSFPTNIPFGVHSKKNTALLEDLRSPSTINSQTLKDQCVKGSLRCGEDDVLRGYVIPTNATGTGLNKTGLGIQVLDGRADWVLKMKECLLKDLQCKSVPYSLEEMQSYFNDANPSYPTHCYGYPLVCQGELLSQSHGGITYPMPDLADGNYTISVFDANSCRTEQDIIVNNGNVSIVNSQDSACGVDFEVFQNQNGTNITMLSGNAPFSVVWNGQQNGTQFFENEAIFSTEDFRPVPLLAYLLELIEEKTGICIKSNFFQCEKFRKIGLDLLQCFGYTDEEAEEKGAYIGLSQDQTIAVNQPFAVIEFDNEIGNFFDNGNNYGNPAYNYNTPCDGVYCVEIQLVVQTLGGQIGDTATVQINNGGNVIHSQTVDASQPFIINTQLDDVGIFAGQDFYISLFVPDANGYIVQVGGVEVPSFVRYTLKPFIPALGQDINPCQYFPENKTVWDLFKDLMKLFNLKVDDTTFLQDRTICVEPAFPYNWGDTKKQGFYLDRSKAVDWTNKLADCQPSACNGFEQKRQIDFCFAVDSNDEFHNEQKATDDTRDIYPNDIQVTFDDIAKFQNITDKIQLECIASTRNTEVTRDIQVPYVSGKDGKRLLKYTPRIYYLEGTKTAANVGWLFNGQLLNDYPCAYQSNDNNPILSFENLYEVFYRQYVESLNINGTTEFMFLLTKEDIVNINPRQLICIDGFYYRLLRLENWQVGKIGLVKGVLSLMRNFVNC